MAKQPTLKGLAQNGISTSIAYEMATDFLIVGAGPAGASLACFMASHGLTGIIVCQDPSSADTPRAHIHNMAANDCLRDIGLDEQCYRLGTGKDNMLHTRWSHSMVGREYARIYSWGNDPKRKGDYEMASPSEPLDIPQTLLEPILMRYATLNGFKVRWDTQFVSLEQDEKGVTTTLFDKVAQQTYRVRSRYLFGADGARSQIVRQLDLPLIRRPGQGFAINILVEADMTHLMENRKGNLHWILQPDVEHPDYAWIGCWRMVKPWHEWLCIIFPEPTATREVRSEAEYLKRVKEMLGDDSIDVKIKGISTWAINETAAEQYSVGNVFCLGDAVHRHPPNHGLGSNTCIQDAFNLAWKVAYVQSGKAGKELLDSFNAERQPVGLEVVTLTNASLRNHRIVWEQLGNFESTPAARIAKLDELKANTVEGEQRRQKLQEALRGIDREEHGLGIEMNQRYRSNAVYHADEGAAPTFDTDALEHYHPTTYPGARLPHVWLGKEVPSKPLSTIDLAGKGSFSLFTGIGGEGWKAAAAEVSKEIGVEISSYAIGYGLEYHDIYLHWKELKGVEDSGCVLVRPDTFVAWRCQRWDKESAEKLREVMKSVLDVAGIQQNGHVVQESAKKSKPWTY
jgi:2-polyprenyl-6-methoxyphenol hydroxylase-like FAD-dependent oxidoreductase